MKKNSTLKLNQKENSMYGIIAFIITFLAFISAIGAILMSAYINDWKILVGIIEYVSLMLTIAATIFTIVAIKEKETAKTIPNIAFAVNLILITYHFAVVYKSVVA